MTNKGTYLFQIRASEVDPLGRVTMASVCNYLQEAAGLHAQALNVASPQLHAQGITWVLARLHVKIERWPGWRESLSIETWPAQIDRLYAVRDFRIRHRSEEIGVATSAWVLIDLQSRRPKRRFPPEIIDLHPATPLRSLADDFAKLRLTEKMQHTADFSIRSQDIDINNHVNNGVFISLLQDNLQATVQDNFQIQELEIEFRGEAFYNNLLRGFISQNAGDPIFHHRLCRNSDQIELIRAITKLRLDG